VAFDGPLDQYFMREPDRLFSRPIERAAIDPSNPQVNHFSYINPYNLNPQPCTLHPKPYTLNPDP
jgi:hypothetical protein